MADSIAKKAIANDIFKAINPHFSVLLGSNTGLGIGTGGVKAQDFNSAIKKWLEQDDSQELIGFLRTAQVTNLISESELDAFLDKIASVK